MIPVKSKCISYVQLCEQVVYISAIILESILVLEVP